MKDKIESLPQEPRMRLKEQARALHHELVDLGMPDDGPTNSKARDAIQNALYKFTYEKNSK